MLRRLLILAVVAVLAVVGWNFFGPGPARPDAYVGDASEFRCQPPYPVGPAPGVFSGNGKVPEDFRPVAAITCDPYYGDVSGSLTAEYVERRWEGDFGAVLRSLNKPSEKKGWLTKYCLASYSAVAVDEMWLLDDGGRAVRPGYPVDDCGMSMIGGLAEVKKLNEVSTTPHPVQLDLQQVEQVSGCTTEFDPPFEGTAPVESRFSAYGFCRFAFEPTGPRFDGSVGNEVQVDSLARSEPCTDTASAVAIGRAQFEVDARTVLIELDGCRKVIVDGFAPMTASEDIRRAFS